MIRTKLILLLLVTFTIQLSGQNSYKIFGKVVDGETGEGLIGATVLVLNSDPMIGAVTDFDGNYSLANIPISYQDIQVSYVSYETKVIEGVAIGKSNLVEMDIILQSSSFKIDEVVVRAKAVTSTESAITALQQKSAGMINGISAQQISKFGDSDVASSIKRVSGVSVTDGKYVFVRGLSDRYSKVTLNGAEIPGLDPNKNTVQMDIFPSSIVDNIIVHKSFTPDLPASFTGGYVNVITKSYPEKFSLHLSTSMGYNPQTNLKESFLTYDGGKYDAFGIDDGSRQIPVEAAGKLPFLYEDNEALDQITKSFSKTMSTTNKKAFLNQSQSFAIGNKVTIGRKDFGFIFSGNYRRSYKSYENGIVARYNLVNSTEGSGLMNSLISQHQQLGEEKVMMSFLAGLSYKITPLNSLNFLLLRNSSGLNSATYKEGYRSEDNLYMYGHTLGFLERDFTSFQLSGKHVIESLNKVKFNWISSFTISNQDEPDLRFFNYDGQDSIYQISYNAYPSPARFYRKLNEKNLDNKLNIDIPLSVFGQKMVFKTGAGYTLKMRTSDSRQFNILSQGLDFDGDIEHYLSDENIGQNAQHAVYGVYIENDPLTDLYNSYTANESVLAAYGMLDYAISSKLKLLLGLRYAHNVLSVSNNLSLTHYKHKGNKKVLNDVFPMLSLKYEMAENMNLRFSYGNTVARPAFREIAPYAYYDYVLGVTVVGNPDLLASEIENFDLRWENFGEKGDLVSFSLFYKYFKNAIEVIDDPRANNPEFTYVNVDKSELYGFEIELKKHLDEINMPNLMIGSNFTLLHSEVKYVADFTDNGESTTLKRPMYGQAPLVFNTYVSYTNSNRAWSSTLSFNIEGEKLAVVTKGKTPNIFKQSYPDLKFNVSKRFADRFKLKVAVGNILNQEYKKVYHYKEKDFVYRSFHLGRAYSFTLSYDI